MCVCVCVKLYGASTLCILPSVCLSVRSICRTFHDLYCLHCAYSLNVYRCEGRLAGEAAANSNGGNSKACKNRILSNYAHGEFRSERDSTLLALDTIASSNLLAKHTSVARFIHKHRTRIKEN